jgi:hypothetical protein
VIPYFAARNFDRDRESASRVAAAKARDDNKLDRARKTAAAFRAKQVRSNESRPQQRPWSQIECH